MDKVERVARVLCAADGKDADSLFSTGEMEVVPTLGGGRVERSKKSPVWMTYEVEARRFVAAFEAMRAAEPEPIAGAV